MGEGCEGGTRLSPKAPSAPFIWGGGRYRRCCRATPLALIPALAVGLLICSCGPRSTETGPPRLPSGWHSRDLEAAEPGQTREYEIYGNSIATWVPSEPDQAYHSERGGYDYFVQAVLEFESTDGMIPRANELEQQSRPPLRIADPYLDRYEEDGRHFLIIAKRKESASNPTVGVGASTDTESSTGSEDGPDTAKLALYIVLALLVAVIVVVALGLRACRSTSRARPVAGGGATGGRSPRNRRQTRPTRPRSPPPPIPAPPADDGVRASVQELETRLSSIDERVGFLEDDVSSCTRQIKALSSPSDSTIPDQLAAIKERVTALETSMNGLRNTELVALRSKAVRLEDAVFHKPPPPADPLSKKIQDAHLGLGGEVALLQRLLGDELADVEKLPRATDSAIADQRLIDLFGTAVKFVNEVDEGRLEGAAGLNTVVSLLRKDVPQWVSSHFGVRVIWPEVNARYDPSWKAVGYDAPPGSDLAYVDRISRVVSVGLERDGTEVQQCSVYRWGHAGRA